MISLVVTPLMQLTKMRYSSSFFLSLYLFVLLFSLLLCWGFLYHSEAIQMHELLLLSQEKKREKMYRIYSYLFCCVL